MTPELEQLLAEYLDGAKDLAVQADLRKHVDAHPEDVAEIMDFVRDAASLQLILDSSRPALPELIFNTLNMDKSASTFTARVVHAIEDDRHLTDTQTIAARDAIKRHRLPFKNAIAILAAAASLVVVAGGVWWVSRQAGAPTGDGVELRVVEVRGSGVRSQGSGVRGQAGVTESPSHPVTESMATSHKPLRAGDILRPGDGVEVGADGYAKLVYPDRTQVELRQNTRLRVTLGTGADKDAKRLALDDGLLICSVAPQKKPFLLETAHAVAEVVGTSFSLADNRVQTTLAVEDGRVDLHQKDQRLEVSAGETAVADAAGMRKLSPADAWITELLARAEAGPWDVVNIGTGVFSGDVWRMDARGGPADRKIWNVPMESNHVSMVSFRDGKRWARGVVVGRMMILSNGRSPAELAGVEMATNIQWYAYNIRVPNEPGKWKASRRAALTLTFGLLERESNTCNWILDAAQHQADVWYRYAVYFDTETPDGLSSLIAVWPEGAAPLPGSAWLLKYEKRIGKNQVEIGLLAKGVLMEVQGIKFVPLGPDMPLPPKELMER